MQINLLPTTI